MSQFRYSINAYKEQGNEQYLILKQRRPKISVTINKREVLLCDFDRFRTRFGYFSLFPGYESRVHAGHVWLDGQGMNGPFVLETQRDDAFLAKMIEER